MRLTAELRSHDSVVDADCALFLVVLSLHLAAALLNRSAETTGHNGSSDMTSVQGTVAVVSRYHSIACTNE